MQAPTETLSGVLERVSYHNAESGFCVLRVKARGQRDLIVVTGHAAVINAGEMLKLRLDASLATRDVARRTGVAPSTLREMLRRFQCSGLSWPLPLDLSDTDLEIRLYGPAGTKQGFRRRAEPDWTAVNRELKRKHVSLQILWDEYIEINPDGYRCGRYCELYAAWEQRLPVTMRQTHLGGDKLFVDYAGDTVPVIVDRHAGRTEAAHIFVAMMGGSSLSFAHASWTETLPPGLAPMSKLSATLVGRLGCWSPTTRRWR